MVSHFCHLAKHLLNVARSLLFQSNIPLVYRSDCVLTDAFLINRLPSHLLKNLSPYECLTGKTPTYNQFKTFSCLCYASTLLKDRNKCSPRALPCIFLGYPTGYKRVQTIRHVSQYYIANAFSIAFCGFYAFPVYAF